MVKQTSIVDPSGNAVTSQQDKPNPNWVDAPYEVFLAEALKLWPDGYLFKLGPNPIAPGQTVLHTVDGKIVAVLKDSDAHYAQLIAEAVKAYLEAIKINNENESQSS
jgi:hypothetical protein